MPNEYLGFLLVLELLFSSYYYYAIFCFFSIFIYCLVAFINVYIGNNIWINLFHFFFGNFLSVKNEKSISTIIGNIHTVYCFYFYNFYFYLCFCIFCCRINIIIFFI